MPQRHAFILANSISYGEGSKNVPQNVVRTLAADLATQLESLGDYSFAADVYVDQTAQSVRQRCRQAIKKAATAQSLLLFYYFGHGVRSSTNDLLLYCRDSDWQDHPSMVKLGEIIEWMGYYNLPSAILILDCCHSGMVSKDLTLLQSYGGKYYFMAAVAAKDKALIDYNDSRPFGIFSKSLLSAFTNSGARVAPTRNVTFNSFFNFARLTTKRQSSQIPYNQDGGLADEVFFKQTTEPIIPGEVRKSVPKKSLYRKLFALGTYVSAKSFGSVDELYSLIRKKQPEEFLTPVKAADRQVDYTVVSRATFSRYIVICRRLGIVEDLEDSVSLSPVGRRMFRRDGAQFNICLYELLTKAWKGYNLSLNDIVDVIAERLRRSSIPSGNAIWIDIFLSKRILIPKWLFLELLDLTAYVGAVHLTSERTFFLAASSERDLAS